MPRKMVVLREGAGVPLLTEDMAANEMELQELLKKYPDLIPVEEFGMAGPLMVLGRETVLPSGAIDLVAMARGGQVLLIEFKTGPQNGDFRAALAQLLDYGSDLWGMPFEKFESGVAQRYFESGHCQDERVKGMKSIIEAARVTWGDLSQEDETGLAEQLSKQLTSGAFHYVVAAQRFTATMERTLEYMNSMFTGPKFYAVELIRFSADELQAFTSRTHSKPGKPISPSRSTIDQEKLLDQIKDELYRSALEDLIKTCEALDLYIYWGSQGLSLRLTAPDKRLITVAWLFPPTVSAGWMGLRDVSLGIDPSQTTAAPTLTHPLNEYLAKVGALPGAEKVKSMFLSAFHFAPQAFVRNHRAIIDAFTELVQRANR